MPFMAIAAEKLVFRQVFFRPQVAAAYGFFHFRVAAGEVVDQRKR